MTTSETVELSSESPPIVNTMGDAANDLRSFAACKRPWAYCRRLQAGTPKSKRTPDFHPKVNRCKRPNQVLQTSSQTARFTAQSRNIDEFCLLQTVFTKPAN